jgi:hypothetical protein
MLDAADHEHLHATKDDAELLVVVAVERDDGQRLELDQVEHGAATEERPPGDACSELEGANLAEVDELGLHRPDL